MADATKYKRPFLIRLLEQMVRIRRFEERAAAMYGIRKIGGFCHLYNGQEAIAVGSIAACNLKKDYVLTSYRDHGHALACGMEPNSVMAELFGKVGGCSRGKGGSMHLFDVERHMFGGNGIVGSQIPVAAGVAFASRYRGSDGVTLCYFGDGAIHQGSFHETTNLAVLWGLPLILIVENNQYGMGTSVERVSSVENFDVKGAAYDIHSEAVNGMCVLTVYEALKRCIKRARKGAPALLDIKTYRYRGHSMSDPGKYRTKADVEKYKKQDPILMLKADMHDADMLTEEQYKEIDTVAKQSALDAVRFSEESPEPAPAELYEHVYDQN